MRIAVENSTWNNIGDGFYQCSLQSLLGQALPQARIYSVDGPPDRAFRPSARFARNALDITNLFDADVFCFSGPILNKKFFERYGRWIEHLTKRGQRFMIMTSHGTRDAALVEQIGGFLRQHKPLAFWTRDTKTYEMYRPYVADAYDGICAAYLCSYTLNVADVLPERRYITSSFYGQVEPDITFQTKSGCVEISSVRVGAGNTEKWNIRRHFAWRTALPTSINGLDVIRLVHDISYKFSHLNYAQPQAYLSFNPLNYLSLYRGTQLTVSDRVHACVATLAYGNPAAYIGADPRADLFIRREMIETEGRVMTLSKSSLKMEYENLLSYIKSRF